MFYSLFFVDIDECALKMDNCPQNSICLNIDGSFNCICPPGYIYFNSKCFGKPISNEAQILRNFSIQDVNECLNVDSICPAHSHCVNYAGKFECKCNEGFDPIYNINKTILKFCKRKD
jgi:hypothetical protein